MRIFVETDRRLYDMKVARDWRTLAEDGVDNAYESEKTSARVKRGIRETQIAAGRPAGTVPYGYRRVYDEHTGTFIRQEPDPDEAPVIRELAERVYRGDALYAIAKDFAAGGIRTRSGKIFSSQHLRMLVLTPTYAGMRAHNVSGAKHDRYRLASGVELHEGGWEPLIKPEVYYAIVAKLSDPARKTERPGRAHHLLSFTARCAKCGGFLTIRQHHGQWSYWCRDHGCVQCAEAELDMVVQVEAIGYLIESGLGHKETEPAAGPELQQARDELAALRYRREEIGEALALGKLSIETVSKAEKRLDEEIARAEKQERELATPAALRALVDDPDWLVVEGWAAKSMPAKREAMKMLLSPDHLGTLYLGPARGEGGRKLRLWERLEWRKAPGSATADRA